MSCRYLYTQGCSRRQADCMLAGRLLLPSLSYSFYTISVTIPRYIVVIQDVVIWAEAEHGILAVFNGMVASEESTLTV